VQLEHSFIVPAGVDQAWTVLLDTQRIAPCLPGVTIDDVDGDDFVGSVRVKLGPINLTYSGRARFIEKNESRHLVVIDAHGRDARGNGTVSATVTARLSAQGPASTRVQILTDLDVTGKPAQFGRGVMADVGTRLIELFAQRLAAQLGGAPDGPAPRADEPGSEPISVPTPQAAEPETIDLLASAGPVILRRLAPILVGTAAAILAVLMAIRRRRQ
jgi:carbon monoxide dehydrogenase subunit G